MSDHFSGPRALAGPACDITDIYAFPSPEQAGRLVLVLDVHPLAALTTAFSDAIVYRFRLRPLTIAQDTPAFVFGPAESELTFTFSFEAPQPEADGARPVQYGYFVAPSGQTERFRVDDDKSACLDGMRVFAGLRSDPFFIDLPGFLETVGSSRLAFKDKGQNGLADTNILAIVVEVDTALLLQNNSGSLFGVVGETVVAGKIPVRLERFGRPEMKNVIMGPKQFDQVNRDLELRDLYNLEDVFHMSKDYRGMYRARLNANLAWFDCLDGKVDWPLLPDGSHPLTDLLLADYMVVDLGKPFSEDGCFEIERALLAGRPHETCGGRSLNHDFMDTLYTWLIKANHGPRISDGVDQATQAASGDFPYLMSPNPVPVTQLPSGVSR